MRRRLMASLLVILPMLVSGCAAATTATHSATPATSPAHHRAMTSKMSMSGMAKGDMGRNSAPSTAARMICGQEVHLDIQGVLAPAEVSPGDALWAHHLYTCTYRLPHGGPLVLSVKDSQDVESGSRYFAQSRRGLPQAEPLHGLISLGLPSYEARQGIVAFLKDGKTLTVDATRLPRQRVDHQSRTDVAYAVAAGVVACWSE